MFMSINTAPPEKIRISVCPKAALNTNFILLMMSGGYSASFNVFILIGLFQLKGWKQAVWLMWEYVYQLKA